MKADQAVVAEVVIELPEAQVLPQETMKPKAKAAPSAASTKDAVKKEKDLREKKPANRQAPKQKHGHQQVIREALTSFENEGNDYYQPTRRRRRKSKMTSDLSHGFERPTQFIAKEIAVPESIMVSDLAQKMSVKAMT